MKHSAPFCVLTRRTLLSWPLGLWLAGAAHAQPDILAIIGKDNYLFPAWGTTDAPDWAAIDANVARVAEVRRRLAARGIALVAPVIPSKKLFYADKLVGDDALTPEMLGRYAGIRDRLAAAKVPGFDAEALFRALQAKGEQVYYRTDQHWTQIAADATAQATAELIHQLVPQLAGKPGTGLALGAITKERRYGDLADRFLSPEQRRAAGREIFTVRRATEQTGLLDSAPAPVHVTGNSMVQPYFGFPQKLSNLLDRPVSVNWKPGDVGFWIVLMEYLESSAFRTQPPQVVVWQLFEPNLHLGPNAKGLWDSASLISEQDWSQRLAAALPA
ncbi:alginate O-acetyltransferase AlgX-related protein [Simplicispira hankyongi]|uniref:Twin-arginine translocation pathway signal n=1 Tax=Simplicispira hankyongi TaxID=2315688 RepID=A0A398CBA8_9BURK|nr:twin-arginine translocation pathway signal [Simplicispira hankyongi]RID98277.1 twin-arginine translocation pathway signal [Simplicispira hankyongi]